mgnify:CR=1 FL=1
MWKSYFVKIALIVPKLNKPYNSQTISLSNSMIYRNELANPLTTRVIKLKENCLKKIVGHS